MANNETEIIVACQAGNTAEFGLLYDAYFKKIYNFIYYKTLHRETTEDLVSLAFMKALKSIGLFKADSGNFQAWLYQIARNCVIDHYRARKEEANIEDIYDLASADDLLIDANNKIALEQVQAYLKKLKPEHREIIMLRLWEGYSYKEIAAMTGRSEANCKMAFARAISKVRAGLTLILLFLYSLS